MEWLNLVNTFLIDSSFIVFLVKLLHIFLYSQLGQCHSYRVKYLMIHRGPGFLVSHHRMIWLHPLPPFLSVSSTGDSQEHWKERRLADERTGGGEGEEPKGGEKAWSSINNSILSVHNAPVRRDSLLKYFYISKRFLKLNPILAIWERTGSEFLKILILWKCV